MTRRLNILLAVLVLAFGLPFYWLLIDTSPHNVSPSPLDIAELRAAADSIPGSRPVSISYEQVAWELVPGDLLAAGSGLKRRLTGVLAFRLEVPGAGPILIDTGTNARQTRLLGFDGFDPHLQRSLDGTIRQASLIVATGKGGDRIGGLGTLVRSTRERGLLTKARLNPAQIAAVREVAATELDFREFGPVISDGEVEALAPGLVAIPAPSVSPGAQMIYVRLAGGEEYLFTGDVAPLTSSWRELRPPARLVTDLRGKRDRAAISRWLRAISGLKRDAPALRIIPGRDHDWLIDPDSAAGIDRLTGG